MLPQVQLLKIQSLGHIIIFPSHTKLMADRIMTKVDSFLHYKKLYPSVSYLLFNPLPSFSCSKLHVLFNVVKNAITCNLNPSPLYLI